MLKTRKSVSKRIHKTGGKNEVKLLAFHSNHRHLLRNKSKRSKNRGAIKFVLQTRFKDVI